MTKSTLVTLGRKEWLTFLELDGQRMVGKVDTGAKTCALHAFYTEPFTWEETPWLRFGLHPIEGFEEPEKHYELPLKGTKLVRDSGGHQEERYVVETLISIGGQSMRAEFTLTSRDNMRYRCLVGRNVLNKRYLVDPGRVFLQSQESDINDRPYSHDPSEECP